MSKTRKILADLLSKSKKAAKKLSESKQDGEDEESVQNVLKNGKLDLVQTYQYMVEHQQGIDVVFVVGQGDDKEEFGVHKIVCEMNSPILAAMVNKPVFDDESDDESGDEKEEKGDGDDDVLCILDESEPLRIALPDADPEYFSVAVQSMYRDQLPEPIDSVNEAAGVLPLSLQLGLVRLQSQCLSVLERGINDVNAFGVLVLGSELCGAAGMGLGFVTSMAEELIVSEETGRDEWLRLPKPHTQLLINSDDTAVDEWDLLKWLIRWGISQFEIASDKRESKSSTSSSSEEEDATIADIMSEPASSVDTAKWDCELPDEKLVEKWASDKSSKNYRVGSGKPISKPVLEYLKPMLDAIRFPAMTSEELEKASGMGLLNSKDLTLLRQWVRKSATGRENELKKAKGGTPRSLTGLTVKYPVTPRASPLMPTGSAILDRSNRELRDNWCWILKDFKRPELKLLWSTKKTGDSSAATFHRHCDNKGPTIVVAKAGKHIFGGYSDRAWATSGSYQSGKNSFIYKIAGPSNMKSQIPGKFTPTNNNHVYLNSSYGPTFGGGHDLYFCNNFVGSNSNYSNRSTYTTAYKGSKASTWGSNYFAGSYNFTVEVLEVYSVKERK